MRWGTAVTSDDDLHHWYSQNELLRLCSWIRAPLPFAAGRARSGRRHGGHVRSQTKRVSGVSTTCPCRSTAISQEPVTADSSKSSASPSTSARGIAGAVPHWRLRRLTTSFERRRHGVVWPSGRRLQRGATAPTYSV